MRPSARGGGVVAVCALLAFLIPASAADGIQGGRVWYTYKKGTSCKHPVDPINVVFYGRDATAGRTDAYVRKYLHWGDATDSSTQGFITPRCRLAAHQRADGPTDETRFHVRLRQRDRKKGERRRFTVGDAHHEDFTGVGPFNGCDIDGGHAVDKGAVDRRPEDRGATGSGFDRGRRKMAARWRARGRRPTYKNKKNTRSFKQCDGDYAGSDGSVAYMSIPKRRR